MATDAALRRNIMLKLNNHRWLAKVAVPAMCGLFTFSVLAPQSRAAEQPKPGLEQKKMEVFVGEWTYEGSASPTPWWPAFNYKGTMTNQMVLGGFFLEMRGQDKSDSGYNFQMVAFQGYDVAKKAYVAHDFQNGGSVEGPFTITVDGNSWTRTGARTDNDGKTYKMKSITTFASDGQTATRRAEYSANAGKSWLPLWQDAWRRAKKER
jgi:hypothetical protein